MVDLTILAGAQIGKNDLERYPHFFLRPLLFAGLDIHEIQVRQLLKSYLCRTVGHFCGNAVPITSFEFYRLEINTTWCSLYGAKFTDKKFEIFDKTL